MTLIEIKYNGKDYMCENTLEYIESEMKLSGSFIKINECYWEMNERWGVKSKRRDKLLLKSNITEITVIKSE